MCRKFIIFLALATVTVVVSGGMSGTIEKRVNECAKETHTTVDVAKVTSGLPNKIEDDKACFYICVAKKFRIVKSDDTVDTKSMLLKLLTKNKNLDSVVKACTEKITTGDKCVKAANRLMCAAKEVVPEKYFQK